MRATSTVASELAAQGARLRLDGDQLDERGRVEVDEPRATGCHARAAQSAADRAPPRAPLSPVRPAQGRAARRAGDRPAPRSPWCRATAGRTTVLGERSVATRRVWRTPPREPRIVRSSKSPRRLGLAKCAGASWHGGVAVGYRSRDAVSRIVERFVLPDSDTRQPASVERASFRRSRCDVQLELRSATIPGWPRGGSRARARSARSNHRRRPQRGRA